jgi:cation/acetate symporter
VGTVRRRRFLASSPAFAFATILAVVAGLVLSAFGAVAHDVWTNVIRKGASTRRQEVRIGPPGPRLTIRRHHAIAD